MKEYINKVINGDCIEVLKQLPTDSTFIITDPPYGKRPTRGKNGFGSADKIQFQPEDDVWDIKPSQATFNELKRVGAKLIIWGGNYFTTLLQEDSNCWLIWDKLTGENPYADCELAWTNLTGVTKMYREQWLGALIKEPLFHPTQKSSKLMEWCIRNFTKPTDIILDPFGGSGTTAVAAIRTNRNFILIEQSKEYCAIAEKRIKDEMNKLAETCYVEDLALFGNVSQK